MNTQEVADVIGTTPRILRAFLRSPSSTFVAVGSNSRYDFKQSELPTLEKRFREWDRKGKPKATNGRKRPRAAKPQTAPSSLVDDQTARDQEVWAEEGDIVFEDIRDPRVRARVLRLARNQEARLEMQLMKAGLHISQRGDRR